MAMALVSSVDNSPMTTYRGFGGASLNTGDIAGARPRVLTRERNGIYPQWNEPLNKPKRLHPPRRSKRRQRSGSQDTSTG